MPLSSAEYRVRPALNVEELTVKMEIIDREEDDENAAVVDSYVIDAKQFPESLRARLFLTGVRAIFAERTSDVTFGGKTKHTPEQKVAAYAAVFAQLVKGEWERERKPVSPVVSAEVEALAELTGNTVAEIQATLRGFTKEDREATLANEEVQAKAKEIRAAREAKTAAGGVDLSRFKKTA